MRTRPRARGQRDEVFGPDESLVVEVEGDGLDWVAVLGEVSEEVRVKGAVLHVLVLRHRCRVRRRVARGFEVVRARGRRAGVEEAGLLLASVFGERLGAGPAAVADEPAGPVAEGFTAVVDGRVVDAAAALAAVRTHVGLADEREPRDGRPVGREVLVDGSEVGLELPELLLDAREDEDALVVGVGVADEVDAGGEREHRLAGPHAPSTTANPSSRAVCIAVSIPSACSGYASGWPNTSCQVTLCGPVATAIGVSVTGRGPVLERSRESEPPAHGARGEPSYSRNAETTSAKASRSSPSPPIQTTNGAAAYTFISRPFSE